MSPPFWSEADENGIPMVVSDRFVSGAFIAFYIEILPPALLQPVVFRDADTLAPYAFTCIGVQILCFGFIILAIF